MVLGASGGNSVVAMRTHPTLRHFPPDHPCDHRFSAPASASRCSPRRVWLQNQPARAADADCREGGASHRHQSGDRRPEPRRAHRGRSGEGGGFGSRRAGGLPGDRPWRRHAAARAHRLPHAHHGAADRLLRGHLPPQPDRLRGDRARLRASARSTPASPRARRRRRRVSSTSRSSARSTRATFPGRA